MAELLDVSRNVVVEEYPEASYLDQACFAERKAAYLRGAFDLVGVRAVATVLVRQTNGWGIEITVTTPGLWAIESDCGEDYLESVYREELQTLSEMLADLGVEYTAPE